MNYNTSNDTTYITSILTYGITNIMDLYCKYIYSIDVDIKYI